MAGNAGIQPYQSRRFRYLYTYASQKHKEFPYDVPYLTSREVWKFVHQSYQYWIGERAWFNLEHESSLTKELQEKLRPLFSPNGTLRFFKEEFLHEIENCMGKVDAHKYSDEICRIATFGFLKQKVPQWTQERAKAHLQDTDMVMKRASVHFDLWTQWCKYRDAGRPMTAEQLKRWVTIKRIEINMTPQSWFIDQHKGEDIQSLWMGELKKNHVDVAAVKKQHIELLQEVQSDLAGIF
jgi:hypothetical protein